MAGLHIVTIAVTSKGSVSFSKWAENRLNIFAAKSVIFFIGNLPLAKTKSKMTWRMP